MSAKHGTIAWTELMTADIEAAKEFYSKVCGWSFQTMPMGGGFDYTMVMDGDRPMLGVMDNAKAEGGEHMPTTWFTYFEVDDVDASVSTVRDAWGTVMQDPFDVPGVGRIAIVQDPTGAGLGLMTSAQQG